MDIRKHFHLSLTVFHVVRTIFKVLQDQRQLVNEVAIKITSNYCDSTSAINENLHLFLWAPPAWWKCSCGSTLLFKWKVFGGFHDHGHCHVQRNDCRWFSTYSSFTCLISVLPSQPASATSEIDIDVEMLKLNGSMQEEWPSIDWKIIFRFKDLLEHACVLCVYHLF